MECSHGFCRVLCTGWSRVAGSVWSSKRGQKPLLFSFGRGIGTHSVDCVWLYWTFKVERPGVTLLFLGSFWVFLVPQYSLLFWWEAHMCFATHTSSLLGVATERSWSSHLFSTCGYSRDAFRRLYQWSLVAWTRFWWRISSSSDWKALITKTGWHLDILWDVVLCPETSQCLPCWRLSATSSVSGPWLCPSWRRQDARPTATTSWYGKLHGFASRFSSVIDGILSLRRRESMETYNSDD